MKLVKAILDNIPAETIDTLKGDFNLSEAQTSSILNSVVPGLLSAIKAKIVTDTDGDEHSNGFLSLISEFYDDNKDSNDLMNSLFSGNNEAISMLTNRVSSLTQIDADTISNIIPSLTPAIMGGVSKMFDSFDINTLLGGQSDNVLGNFFSESQAGKSLYGGAIKAANSFIGSIFGGDTQKKMSEDNASMVETNGSLSMILDLFDQDNDGSVMDDIYHMLVK